MVFQDFELFAFSLKENIILDEQEDEEKLINTLKMAGLYDDAMKLENKLDTTIFKSYDENGTELSGGQQQRICIARAIAVQPEVILMDEPTSALDPVSTLKIEELMNTLKEKYTVAIVTHNMQQATRISDYTAFFLVGEMVEYAPTEELFSRPVDKRTEDYITGRFG